MKKTTLVYPFVPSFILRSGPVPEEEVNSIQDMESGPRRARLGPAARLGPQPLGVRLELEDVHGGIIFEILAKGRKSP